MISKGGEEEKKSRLIDETQQNPLSQESFETQQSGTLKSKQVPKNCCQRRTGVHSQHWWVMGPQSLTCKLVILPLVLLLLLEQTQTPNRYLAEAACQAEPASWLTELSWWQSDSAGGEKGQGRF